MFRDRFQVLRRVRVGAPGFALGSQKQHAVAGLGFGTPGKHWT